MAICNVVIAGAGADRRILLRARHRGPRVRGRRRDRFTRQAGGLGAQQADTAAAGIAHLAGAAASPGPLMPVIRSTLLTGDKPLYLVARVERGLGWSSKVHEHPPWPGDHKVVAEELGPYLASMPPDLLA